MTRVAAETGTGRPGDAGALLEQLRDSAADAGLNLVGALDAAEFDACQPVGRRVGELVPGCATIVVLGSGGPAFWDAMAARGAAPRRARPGHHPIRDRGRAIGQKLLKALAVAGHPGRYLDPEDRPALNFLQLAEMAGLGTISPVAGFLLHPEHGPWVSLRGALLLAGPPLAEACERAVPADFQPCLRCERPCLQACPQQVHRPDGGVEHRRCADHRHAGGCQDGCEVRRACPLGTESRYGPDEERFRHAYSLFMMQRHYGLGAWRLVPRALRQR